MQSYDITTKQEKYRGNFDHSLIASRDLVELVIQQLDIISPQDFSTQNLADMEPWKCNGFAERLWDINVRYVPIKYEFKIECKDFCQALCFPLTGLPVEYVRKLLAAVKAKDLFIIFRDSDTYINGTICRNFPNNGFFRDSMRCLTEGGLVEAMIKAGFLENKNGLRKYKFYGNRLSTLMKNCVANRVKCSWSGRYNKADQYMWPINKMLLEADLLNEMKKNSCD